MKLAHVWRHSQFPFLSSCHQFCELSFCDRHIHLTANKIKLNLSCSHLGLTSPPGDWERHRNTRLNPCHCLWDQATIIVAHTLVCYFHCMWGQANIIVVHTCACYFHCMWGSGHYYCSSYTCVLFPLSVGFRPLLL